MCFTADWCSDSVIDDRWQWMNDNAEAKREREREDNVWTVPLWSARYLWHLGRHLLFWSDHHQWQNTIFYFCIIQKGVSPLTNVTCLLKTTKRIQVFCAKALHFKHLFPKGKIHLICLTWTRRFPFSFPLLLLLFLFSKQTLTSDRFTFVSPRRSKLNWEHQLAGS